ncbi:MAG: hypothetical protein QXY98_01410 [Thermoplasmata archaeon]
MVELVDIVLAIASFGPAIALLYFTLRDYTHPKVEKPFFDDRKVFALLTLGIIIGMIFFFVDTVMRAAIANETILLVAVTVPLLQSLIKLAVLNWPRFQRKVDTAFYGLAFGAGIASTYAFSQMEFAVRSPGQFGLESVDPLGTSVIVMLGVQSVFIQCSTTAMIGVGCARGEQWAYFANAMMYALIYSFLIYGSAFGGDYLGEIATVAIISLAWIACVLSYLRIYRIDYPKLIVDAKRGLRKKK